MIKSIRIKNFILIDEIQIELSPNLNIITGETGSGKSMLLDALLVLFGDRASADFVRKGESKSIIEAEIIDFNDSISKYLQDNELESNGELILRREISAKGTSRNFINDTPVNLSQLKEIGELLIDFHGQHEHQSLLNSMNHIQVLDSISDYKDKLKAYEDKHEEIKAVFNELNLTLKKEKELNQQLSYRNFIYEEIMKVNPIENEDLEIENELSILENSEQILSYANEIYESLYGDDDSIFNRLSDILTKLEKINQFHLNIDEQISEINSTKIISKEVSSSLKSITDRIEFSPERIEELRSRYSILKSLKKKHGTLDEILKLKKEIQDENSFVESFADKIEELNNNYKKLQFELGEIANHLSKLRKESSDKIAVEISNLLNSMGINYVDFQTRYFNKAIELVDNNKITCMVNGKYYLCNDLGIDQIEFYISTNKGQDVAPLAEVASGGEISRIMLALKKITSDNDIIDTMVFDEIDTGISGRIAQMVGSMMKQISLKKQIIAITHLAQIAAFGDKNFVIKKSEENSTEVSRALELNNESKLNEIAKMISGESITQSTLNSALELINYSKQ